MGSLCYCLGVMTKSAAKRKEIADKIADFILAEGLLAANLRPLASAAGLSDRMLLYYFKDKEDVITSGMARVMERLGSHLLALAEGGPRPYKDLEASLLKVTLSGELWPYMCVWLETAALAARGDPIFRRLGGEIAQGFQSWIAAMLLHDQDGPQDAAAERLLRTIEGAIVLSSVGFISSFAP